MAYISFKTIARYSKLASFVKCSVKALRTCSHFNVALAFSKSQMIFGWWGKCYRKCQINCEHMIENSPLCTMNVTSTHVQKRVVMTVFLICSWMPLESAQTVPFYHLPQTALQLLLLRNVCTLPLYDHYHCTIWSP